MTPSRDGFLLGISLDGLRRPSRLGVFFARDCFFFSIDMRLVWLGRSRLSVLLLRPSRLFFFLWCFWSSPPTLLPLQLFLCDLHSDERCELVDDGVHGRALLGLGAPAFLHDADELRRHMGRELRAEGVVRDLSSLLFESLLSRCP